MNILRIAAFELAHIFRMKTVLTMLLVLPLVLIFILGTALSGDFKEKDVITSTGKVAFYHADEGMLQTSVKQFLQSSELTGNIQAVFVSSEDMVAQMLQKHEVDYGIIIPANFSANVLEGKAASWTFYPGTKPNKNVMIEAIFQSFVQHINNIQAAVMTAGPHAMHSWIENEENFAFDAPSYVKVGTLKHHNHHYTALQYYSAAYLIMFLLFSGMATAISILSEKESGTLLRLYSLPVPPVYVLLGKLLGNTVFACLQAFLLIIITSVGFGVYWGDQWLYLISFCLLAIVAAMSIGFTFAMWFKTSKAAETVFSLLIFTMTFFSGGMIPDLGETAAKIGKFTLNHWAANGVLAIMIGDDNSAILQNLQILMYIVISLLCIAILNVRRISTHE